MFNQAETQKLTLLIGNTDLVNQVCRLSNGAPDEMMKESKSVSQPLIDRAAELVIELKTYLIQMVAEAQEYNDPKETQRLQSEAVGILISLREIIRHFPEVKHYLT